MANQFSSGSVDRQYLRAMGIDLWVDKKSTLHASVPTSPAVSTSVSSDSGTAKALAQMSVTEFTAAVDDLMLTCSEPLRSAELLVVTEGSGLTEAGRKLLESMFKAIELDTTQWFQAAISNPSDKEAVKADDSANRGTVSEIEKAVNPKALVVLLQTGGSASALDALRNFQHRPRMLQSFVVVSFHPQDLLDNPDAKRPAWEDLKQLRQWLS